MTDERPPSHLRPVPWAGAEAEVAGAAEPGDGITQPTLRAQRGRFISDVVSDLGILPRDRVEAAVEEGRASGRTPEQVLLDSGALSQDQLARAIAERFGLPHVDLTLFQVDLSALNLLTAQTARRFTAVPIGFDEGGALMVAMADPANVLAIDDLKLMTGQEIRPVVASAEDIGAVIGRMTRLDEAVAEAVEEEEEEDPLHPVTDIRESAEDAPVIKLVNSIVAEAVEAGASDIHMEPEGKDMRVRFRVDGVLAKTTEIPRRMVAGVVSRFKIMGDLDISERRIPQDGRLSLAVEGHHVDIRVVTVPSVNGEGVVLRLLDKDQVLLDLDSLGVREASRERFERSFRQTYGAVLVCGPTGSGKTTTLYSALSDINSVEKNIVTIEDPVEYRLPGITQLQVHPKAGLTFVSGLRSMLRADPDVIMVGEIRDSETARIAVESALTGHLVLSTLHTNDAPSAIDCIVAQRLARTLCGHCKQRTVLTADALAGAGFNASFDIEAYEPVGCARCGHSGYKGRLGLFEVMELSDEIRSMAIERRPADEIRTVACEQGMRLLREDGLDKVKLGATSIEEVARVT